MKTIKLNENTISMILGGLVVIVVIFMGVKYFRGKEGKTIPALSTTANEIGKSHKVIKGETLWSIAEDNYGSGYNWVDIKSANNLKGETIEVDQELLIPDVPSQKPTSTVKVATAEVKPVIADNTYTVAKGDCLWTIAVRAYGDGFRWVEIAKINNLKNPNIIHTGNVLTLPR